MAAAALVKMANGRLARGPNNGRPAGRPRRRPAAKTIGSRPGASIGRPLVRHRRGPRASHYPACACARARLLRHHNKGRRAFNWQDAGRRSRTGPNGGAPSIIGPAGAPGRAGRPLPAHARSPSARALIANRAGARADQLVAPA